MCAVQLRSQLNGETKCRQWKFILVLVLLPLALQRLNVACSIDIDEPLVISTVWSDATIDECHDDYLLASANASSIFALSHELCELTANETKIDLSIDEQLERTQIEIGRTALCGNLELCNTLDDDLEYLACINDSGRRNLQLITEINHNATSAHTRLREDYNEVQRTMVLCTLEAQVVYVNSMREAHEKLQQCRIELAEHPTPN
ncbi:uncharacterized protein LOC117785403 [Drosophila innubila]|uniref:uncharacterized protein LOC117785403 n=1 Tax=Drosophila innubila TaxID=198719 RepID=UPI00148CF745|nr:uncharacterized protein LOC117785403 [Drosophila innubila]